MTDLDQRRLQGGTAAQLQCIGVVAHPTRDIEQPWTAMRDWAQRHGAELVEIPFGAAHRGLPIADADDVEHCDLVVAIGGDGTTLAAIRVAAAARRPVLGVACGSLGALTTVPSAEVAEALARLASGDWRERELPALTVTAEGCADFVAFNDIVVVRGGEGQVRVAARVDGALYTRTAGDGCVVSTPTGSGAYTIAAGGPLVAPELEAFALTALPIHGGFSPPLVLSAGSTLELEITTSHSGGRLEVDGRLEKDMPVALSIAYARAMATVVAFPGRPSHLSGLRERGILMDSPRILADDKRAGDKRAGDTTAEEARG